MNKLCADRQTEAGEREDLPKKRGGVRVMWASLKRRINLEMELVKEKG